MRAPVAVNPHETPQPENAGRHTFAPRRVPGAGGVLVGVFDDEKPAWSSNSACSERGVVGAGEVPEPIGRGDVQQIVAGRVMELVGRAGIAGRDDLRRGPSSLRVRCSAAGPRKPRGPMPKNTSSSCRTERRVSPSGGQVPYVRYGRRRPGDATHLPGWPALHHIDPADRVLVRASGDRIEVGEAMELFPSASACAA